MSISPRCALIGLLALGATACGDGPDSLSALVPDAASNNTGEPDMGPRDPRSDEDEDGLIAFVEETIGTHPDRADSPCSSDTYTHSLDTKTPRVDFLFIIDTSGSMIEELALIRRGLTRYFASLNEDGALDATVIVLADYGLMRNLCVAQSANDTSCADAGAMPAKNDRFLFYDAAVSSRNAYEVILRTARQTDPWSLATQGWAARLREDADLAVVMITDDNSRMPLPEFERHIVTSDLRRVLLDDQDRWRMTFHTIGGVQSPPHDLFWRPAQSIVTERCPSAANTSATHQQLSRTTGGLRASVCEAADYAKLLEQIASSSYEGYLPCSFDLPISPDIRRQSNPLATALQLELPHTSPEPLYRVGTESRCDARSYTIRNTPWGASQVTLCPDLCSFIREQTRASLTVASSCRAAACEGSPTHSTCE